jgi:hypothetical protein
MSTNYSERIGPPVGVVVIGVSVVLVCVGVGVNVALQTLGRATSEDVFTLVVLGVGVLVGLGATTQPLRLDVCATSVRISIAPFVWRTISLSSLQRVTTTAVSIRQYGGSGYRWAPTRPPAILQSSGPAVRLDYGADRHLIVQTREPEAFAAAIRSKVPDVEVA